MPRIESAFPYENLTVYLNKDKKNNRNIVCLYDKQLGTRRTISYAKYLWETTHKKFVPKGFDVDHKDDDKTNDVISNLQLIRHGDHQSQHANANQSTEWHHFNCPVCGIASKVEMRFYKNNQIKQKKAGPFCSKTCAGTYSTDVQYGSVAKLETATDLKSVEPKNS